jgi:hypothetical protein
VSIETVLTLGLTAAILAVAAIATLVSKLLYRVLMVALGRKPVVHRAPRRPLPRPSLAPLRPALNATGRATRAAAASVGMTMTTKVTPAVQRGGNWTFHHALRPAGLWLGYVAATLLHALRRGYTLFLKPSFDGIGETIRDVFTAPPKPRTYTLAKPSRPVTHEGQWALMQAEVGREHARAKR